MITLLLVLFTLSHILMGTFEHVVSFDIDRYNMEQKKKRK